MPQLPQTVESAARELRNGSVTSVELTKAALAAADELDPVLGTFVTRFSDHALERAAEADDQLARGDDRGPLHGIPIGIKDLFAVAEGPTTAQSLVLDREWGAGKDAPVIARIKAGGAVIVGKTTTNEFAIGMPDDDKPFPKPRNPWNTETWAGGSSAGAGSGVATGAFMAALATDTAGSIRIPAAFCGVTGLMPTYGRVSKAGCVPLAYSMDHVGPLARSARDCAAILQVIAGPDPADPDCVNESFLPPVYDGDLSGVRVGVVRTHAMVPGASAALAPVFDSAVAVIAGMGATLVEVELPLWVETVTAAMVTLSCEALAYHKTDMSTRWGDYFQSTRAVLATGALLSGADYVQAQRVRRVTQDAVARAFDDVDVILGPTAAIGAPSFTSIIENGGLTGLDSLLPVLFTTYWDAVGNPVLAMPMGFDEAGMPLSLQVAGPAFGEGQILRVADAFQQHTDWHLRRPALADREETGS